MFSINLLRMTTKPLVSVIINCYNGESFLKEAINSVFQQTYDNWEIIFFDNRSTDNSKEIACTFGDKVNYFCSTKHLTLGSARKEAIKYASGQWICFLDTDDLWYPDKLSSQVLLTSSGNSVLIYSGIDNIDINGKFLNQYQPKLRCGNLLDNLLDQFDINMVTPMINSKFLFENRITFNSKIYASEEYNLFLRIAAKGLVQSVPDIHGAYRVYEGSLTDQKIEKWAIDRFITLRQLNRENKGLKLNTNPFFIKAKMHARYYSARYYMSIGNYKKAKQRLLSLRFYRPVYFLLWCLAHYPRAWDLIHQRSIKSYISKYFAR